MARALAATFTRPIVFSGKWLLDLVLPPRCPGCGAIVDTLNSFCVDCWISLRFLGDSGCVTCGIPLEAIDAAEGQLCGACLAVPPRIARTRAAVAYDDISRRIAIRLKFGNKVALAKAMARYMAPLLGEVSENALLVPVPLHRWWIAVRGFNQALLVAREIGRLRGVTVAPRALRRTRATPPLKGMGLSMRQRTVTGAFKVRDRAAVAGRTIILIDDVLTTGSTADACARALRRGGGVAHRTDLLGKGGAGSYIRSLEANTAKECLVAKVELYVKSTCSYCLRARQLLDDKGVAHDDYDVDMGGPKKEEMVQRAGGRTSVPQIFIDGKHIGGCDDLVELDRQGKLDELLAA